jgi:hypothetical protein
MHLCTVSDSKFFGKVTEWSLRLRVFHTAVQYGLRHVNRYVKLIETSAEERASLLN